MNNKFLKQIMFGCENTCNGIFCGKNTAKYDQTFHLKVSEHIRQYGDLFTCGNYKKLEAYVDRYSKTKSTKKSHTLKIDFKNLTDQTGDFVQDPVIQSFFDFTLHVLDALNSENSRLDKEVCKPLERRFDDKESCEMYLLHNIFRLFLKKYSGDKNPRLGLIALRVFTRLKFEKEMLTEEQASVLSNLLTHIYTDHALSLQTVTNKYDFSHEAMHTEHFTIRDFANTVTSLVNLLNLIPDPFISTNKVLEDLLDGLTLMHSLNLHLKVFPYQSFYLVELCKRINIKEEFRYSKVRSKSIITYSFILPLETKAELLKYEHSDGMKASLQDAFFQALYEGPVEPYLFVKVRRSMMYADITKLLLETPPVNLMKQIRITFDGEEGIDSGGIRKEFFQLLSVALVEELSLFVEKSNVLWFNSQNNNHFEYTNFGKILGIAFYNDVLLNIPFPKIFFKKMLDKQTDLNDIGEIEPELHATLQNILSLSHEDMESADLSYEITFSDADGESKQINLNGKSHKKVSIANRVDFVTKYVDFVANINVEKQFKAVKAGFFEIVPPKSISFLHPSEFEKIISGHTYINVNELRVNATLSNYTATDDAIINFWSIFEEYSTENQRKLLQFITGNDRVPVCGSECLKLTIMKNGCDTERLPSSQTCFNTILLPEYSSRKKMEEKLYKAITMTKGFYLM